MRQGWGEAASLKGCTFAALLCSASLVEFLGVTVTELGP